MKNKNETTNSIILFDGVCNFCNYAVNLIIKNDTNQIYKFSPIQSEIGQYYIKKHPDLLNTDSVILVEGNNVYIESEAALKISKNLKYPWRFFYIFIYLPYIIRNPLYKVIAKNRYKLFGKQDVCIIPTKEIKNRFL